MASLPAEIFKAYDIRGIVGKTLTPQIVELIGHAFGSESLARGQNTVAIGRDGEKPFPISPAHLERYVLSHLLSMTDLPDQRNPLSGTEH